VTSFWRLLDGAGADAGESEVFDDRDDAESWLQERWQELRSSGVEAVALVEDGDEAYRMSLAEAEED
jgi:hypothetical protein